ncbi:MAG TPA: ABC transporter permease [Chitinophagaceae bacterium]|nr:ABC transporter permease [Chitinophagaceae bacterium]
MLQNYLKVAWRNLMKNKTFSFINVFGLSIGLTCCLLISLYIYHELSYDSYHKNVDRLYQVGTVFVKKGKEDKAANTPAPMAQTLQQEFPEIEATTKFMSTFAEDKTLLQYTDGKAGLKSFYETRGFLADSTFFKLFNYNFKEGNPATALNEPNCVVLSEEIAKKFFGNESALNKVLHISSSTNGDYDFKVTGVFKPNTIPSHIDGRFFMSLRGGDMEGYIRAREGDLVTNNMFFTYVLLKPGADAKALESKFPAFLQKYASERLKAMGLEKKQYLTPVRKIHLSSDINRNVTAPGSITYLYILGSIAVFTLLIACINFMNLSTARSSKRSAEVGVRKVLGAEKQALIRQFLGESLLMALIAFAVALIITQLLLPLFGQVAGKQLVFSVKEQAALFAGFFVLAVITGLIAGSYPAFYLSSFKPVKVLKGRFTNSLAAVSLRKGLVVFQFFISVVLIVASVVIYNQMQYLRSKDLGFNKEHQIIIPLRSNIAKGQFTALESELARNPRIASTGGSLYYPGIFNPSDQPLYKEGSNMSESKRVFMNWVDDSFLQTLGIKPVKGRLFSPEFPSDTSFRIILNETAIQQIGFASGDEALGRYVMVDWQGQTYRYEIVGIVKDFHFQALHLPIEPYGFQLNNVPQFNYIVANAKPGNIQETVKSIESTWRKLNPNEPFDYSFLDSDFMRNYVAENRLASIVSYFTVIAILISCLGLFGLAAFSAEQRTKEIGVRKVLGASVPNIIALLSKDFLKLVAVSVIIASPVAWYVMNQWLQDFAYRTDIKWTVFAITAATALCIALLTIGFQAMKAALSNPVKSLRTE